MNQNPEAARLLSCLWCLLSVFGNRVQAEHGGHSKVSAEESAVKSSFWLGWLSPIPCLSLLKKGKKGRWKLDLSFKDVAWLLGCCSLFCITRDTVEVRCLHTSGPNISCHLILVNILCRRSVRITSFIFKDVNVRIEVERGIYFSCNFFHHIRVSQKFTWLVFSRIGFLMFTSTGFSQEVTGILAHCFWQNRRNSESSLNAFLLAHIFFFQFFPQLFCWLEFRALWSPLKYLDFVVLKPLCSDFGSTLVWPTFNFLADALLLHYIHISFQPHDAISFAQLPPLCFMSAVVQLASLPFFSSKHDNGHTGHYGELWFH